MMRRSASRICFLCHKRGIVIDPMAESSDEEEEEEVEEEEEKDEDEE